MKDSKTVQFIVLAGGKGTRMGSDLPKVLVPLLGKPMISHLLDAVVKSGLSVDPVIVTGHRADLVQETLGDKYIYANQKEQKGTAHAVLSAKAMVVETDAVIVLYGDHPNVSAEMIHHLWENHQSSDRVMTMGTARVTDFQDWRSIFHDFGRVVRSADGKVQKIVEKKDANPDELNICEVSPSYFCFSSSWLWEALDMVGNNNAKGEYYLTDLVGLAIEQKLEVNTFPLIPEEALGANTPEHLKLLEEIMATQYPLLTKAVT